MRIPDICPSCNSPAPQSFAALMELYEANYIRLRQLIPGILQWQGSGVSTVPGALDLHARVLEQTRHTTTLWLSYDFGESCPEKRHKPDLVVRLYSDARQAEVLSRSCRLSEVDIRRQQGDLDTLLLCKWRLNRFLYKWLGYCLRQGHKLSVDNVVEESSHNLPCLSGA
jgi:uncharacterized protein